MKYHQSWIFLLFIFIIFTVISQAQEIQDIEIKHANVLTGVETSTVKYRKLIGDVLVSHGDVLMYCDSLYDFIDQNYVDAFGHIRIEQGDSLYLTGKFLHYDLKEKIAHIKDDVKMSDRRMVLTTDKIIYDLKARTGYYDSKAKIVDSTNTLTSEKGYYFASRKEMIFKNNVRLTNPDNNLTCDSLKYNVNRRIAYFLSPTQIRGKKTFVYCEGGWYNTAARISEFTNNAYIKSEGQVIYGDILNYELQKGYGHARGHVKLVDSTENVTVTGKIAEHFKPQKISLVTDSVLMIKYMSNDTMYIHADTLKVENQDRGDTLLFKAFHHVISFSRQFSFKTDSLIYSGTDSTIYYYTRPVLWSGKNQITAKNIRVFLKNRVIDHTLLENDAYIISMKDSLRYDQIKGRNMIGYFDSNELKKVNVKGNAEAIYYLLDDHLKYIGMNKIAASYIDIYLKNKKIIGITFQLAPSGNVLAPVEMDSPASRLKGFNWRGKERPENIQDLFLKAY